MKSPLIEVDNIYKSFPVFAGSINVLNGITITIHRGEMMSIVGASGVGKSTFLQILGALDRPSSGRLLYEGKDIFALSDDALASFRNRSVGFVFQFHHLLPEFSALENVMMPGLIMGTPQKNVRQKAESLLGELGLGDRFSHKPGEMSGGEQQRVAVARALILDPMVVLADEPTGNLDTKTGEELFDLLKRLNTDKGITFVIVTHNEKLASECHRTIKMLDGRIVDAKNNHTP